MPEREHALAVVIGDRAERGDAEIAVHQNRRDAVARVQRLLPAWSGLRGMRRRTADSLDGMQPELLEHGSEVAEGVARNTGECERRIDRGERRKLERRRRIAVTCSSR